MLTILTMRIDRIEASKHKRGRVLLFLEDGACLKITEQELLDFGLHAGDELDEDTRSRLKAAAGVSDTRAAAAEIMGRRAMSRRDLERKLQEKVLRFLNSSMAQVTPDSQGRILLPPDLTGYAGIDRELAIVGVGDHVLIYAADLWHEEEAAQAANLEAMRKKMREIGL